MRLPKTRSGNCAGVVSDRAKTIHARSVITCLVFAVLFCSPGQATSQKKHLTAGSTSADVAINKLTPAEKAAGWKLLFDGKSTSEWRGIYQQDFPKGGWVIEDGTLKHAASPKGSHEEANGGDIVTRKEYSSFELKLDWRIAPGANSGVKYFVTEKEQQQQGKSGIGFEMQILDDDRHPDAKAGKNGNRTAGSLYDLIAPNKKVLRPVGEFNEARLLVQGNHVEHWLNGVKILEFERHSAALRALIAESKYKNIPGFGEAEKGHILLQDHGDEVVFRNIKIRELPSAQH